MMRESIVPASHDPFEALAQRLLRLAGDQSVRVIEALAAALINRSAQENGVADDDDREGELAPRGLQEAAAPFLENDLQRLQLCRRIARRALRGSLTDPTRGATAFHRIETTPEWSRRLLPVAVFGSFLFYRR
jgi:N-acetylmuramoyl-L-alanine amidase